MSGPHAPFVESFIFGHRSCDTHWLEYPFKKNHKNYLPVLFKPFSNINIPEETPCL